MEICAGDPLIDGLYICYLDNALIHTYADRKMLMWFQGKWGYPMSSQNYRGHVYGWIGPLPVMKFEDLPKQEYDL